MTIEDMVDEVVENDAIIKQKDQEGIPNVTDPQWVDFILDKLENNELSNGAPMTAGLRRVAEKYFGEILVSDTDIIEIPKEPLNGKATAKHTLEIRKYYNDVIISVSACVDVLTEKLPYPFNQHVISTACTRAEGKALRRALKLHIQTAEELANVEEEEPVLSQPINDQQIAAIKTMCKRTDTNLVSLIRSVASEKVSSIQELDNMTGRKLISELSEFQREGTPTEFKGFDPNWKESFGGK